MIITHITVLLALPYTYDNAYVRIIVSNVKDTVDLYDEIQYTDYTIPDEPEQGAGRLSGITVCIDPGHQANGQFEIEEIGPGLEGTKKTTPGMARGTETLRLESMVVLEIGFLLRDVLLMQGATVVMTRETQDTYVSNIGRAEIAANADADYFLRLHGNNRDNETIQGIAIYAPVGSDYAKAIADRDGWLEMCEILLSAMQNATGQKRGSTSANQQLYWEQTGRRCPAFSLKWAICQIPWKTCCCRARLISRNWRRVWRTAYTRWLSIKD